MFDRIAPRYDLLNRLLSLGTDLSWRRRALDLAQLGESGRALDVGTGTGDFALALLARSPRSAMVTGVDISSGMLQIAERRAGKARLGPRYERLIASVESLPFADGVFDVAMAGFVIRNVGDIPRGLREMRRVLRSGGRISGPVGAQEPSRAIGALHPRRDRGPHPHPRSRFAALPTDAAASRPGGSCDSGSCRIEPSPCQRLP